MRYSILFTFVLIFINLSNTSAQNLIQNGAFELGGPGNGFMVDGAGYVMLTPPFSGTTVDGNYGFGTNSILFNSTFLSSGDHTTGAGIMMMVDGNTTGGQQRFYKAGNTGGGVCGLTVGLTYTFSYWIRSISANSNTIGTRANIGVQFNNVTSSSILSGTVLAPPPSSGWVEVVYQFVPNSACVNIELFNNNVSSVGNNFAIDDLTVLGPPNSLQFTHSIVQAGCGSPTNFIAVYAKGGTAPYAYQLSGAASLNNTTGSFNNLQPGTYNITVTDANNATVTVSNVTIAPNTTSGVVTQDLTICSGQSATLVSSLPVTAGNWVSAPNDPSLTAVNSTTFSVSPTQTTTYSLGGATSNNLIYNGSFQMGATGFFTQHQLLTNNPNVGQGVAGVTSNSQLWFNPFASCTDQDATNTLLVVDAATQPNVTVWSQVVPVQPNTNYTFSYWATSVVNISPGQLQVIINGTNANSTTLGTTTCSWQNISTTWNSGTSTTATIQIMNTNLASNGNDFAIDNLSFTRAADCAVTVTVTPNTPLQLNPTYTFCVGGTINLSVPNTTNLVWTTPSGATVVTNNLIINNAQSSNAGLYSVSVQGVGTCSSPAQTTVTVSPGPTLSTTVQNVLCFGQTNGSATVTPVGNAPFTYAWSNSGYGPTIQNLSPQGYSVQVTDNNNCTSTANVTITQPGQLFGNINIVGAQCGQSNGSATAAASGGTAPYTYSWSNGNTGTNATNLAAGNHSLTVTDANLCSQTFNFAVGQQQSTLSATVNPTSAICTQSNGSATVVITGGTAPFTITWSNGNTGNSATGFAPGNHSVTVVDANMCSQTVNFTIGSQPSNLNVSATTVNAQCNQPNGSATAVITGGTAPFNITWSNGNSGNTATGLAAGNHSVTVVDANLCSQTFNFTVGSQLSNLNVSATTINAQCNQPNGSATVVITGGTAPFNVTWSNGNSGTTATGLAAGNHSVTVVDANLCSQTFNFSVINQAGTLAVNVTTTGSQCVVPTGTATVQITGGTAPFVTTWSNGNSGLTASNLPVGNHSVTVLDANMCSQTVNFSITQLNGPSASAINIVDVSCFGANNGAAEIDVNGGFPPYVFAWTPNASFTSTANNLAAGTYQVTVTDNAGCQVIVDFNIIQPEELDITPTASNPTCGLANGTIALDVEGGNGIYTYAWQPNSTTTAVATNLAAGTYSVVVTDGNGCSDSISETLITTGTIPITPNASTITIDSGNPANIGVIVGGGITNFSVLWSPAQDITCPTCQYTQANTTENATYTVNVTTPDGCVASTSINVIVEIPCIGLFLPTIFSPNVDDLNDFYCILGTCLESVEFSIYNRWGELVFYTNDQNRCWDGSFRGKDAPVGVYAYKFSSTDSNGKVTIVSGNISLVR